MSKRSRSRQQLSRRRFLRSAAAVSGATLAAPFIAPASALGKGGRPAPSERVVMGCIGVGGRGTSNMRTFLGQADVQVVAVCDVEKRSTLYHHGRLGGRDPAREIVEKHYSGDTGHKGCKSFEDFRELLAIKDIDAVSIATPDHWHALTSIAAANAGKDVYCEKPLANSVAEGRAVVDAVTKNKRILQTGSHERSRDDARYAAELVRNGRIGELKAVRIQMPCDEDHHLAVRKVTEVPPVKPVPESLDYDFWLGHTPAVPYIPERCHFYWRFALTYGGGEMTDRGAHVLDIAQLGMGMDHTGPVAIEARGVRGKGIYDVFWDYEFTNTYANGLQMIGTSEGPRGIKFVGSEGWIFVHIHGCKLEASKPSILKEKIGSSDKVHLGRNKGHHRQFVECCKTRETPFASAEIGHRSGSICHLNNIAMLTGRKLEWDPKRERFKNDDASNRLLAPKMRAPWSLPELSTTARS